MSVNLSFEEEVNAHEQCYLHIFDQLPVLIWRLNMEGVCNWVNARWLDFTGQRLEQEIGNGWVDGIHPEDYEKCLEMCHANLKSRNGFEMVYRLKHHTGEFRWIKTITQPFMNPPGNFAGFIGTSYDIHEGKIAEEGLRKEEQNLLKAKHLLEAKVNERTSEIKKSEKKLKTINHELSKKNDDLTKMNSDLDNFIYTASHDLKAPVSNIEGLVHVLKDMLPQQGLDETIFRMLEMIQVSIERFKKTIIDLTEISKVQKQIEDEQTEIDFLLIFNEVRESIRNQIDEEEVKFITDLKEIDGIDFSEKNMRSIMYNLLSNAIKYRDPFRKPEIRVTTKSLPKEVLLSIEDNGLGIPPDKINQIFTMFKRLHSHVEGSGIGLYIVKRMVDNASGRIEVESQLGKGTTFKIFLRKKKEML